MRSLSSTLIKRLYLKIHHHHHQQHLTRKMNTTATFETLNFDNLTLRSLPIDQTKENYVRKVKDACFSRVQPTPVVNPVLLAYSKSAMELLDLPEDQLKREDAAEFLSGNKLMNGSEPAAHCYCGHQFGVFAGQLGDGAAMYLGEVVNHKNERWELQLKGSGPTPYSRTADGRKVLRSSLREFICSEAMHHLGIATTRSGSCLSSDTQVERDMFYDGNGKLEKCAVITRIAPTFIRFGSFEICRPLDRSTGGIGPSCGNKEILPCLLDYVSNNHFKSQASIASEEENKELKYERVFEEIVRRTAALVAEWQCVGFVHGVLNTDNMSIVGVTIDYGPFGFLDRYNPDHIFNGSDKGGRYTYREQVKICEWNCSKLAEVLDPMVPLAKGKEIIARVYKDAVAKHYIEKMRKKLGLLFSQEESDKQLVEELLQVMYETGADFSNSFRRLARLHTAADVGDWLSLIQKECSSVSEMKALYKPKIPKETLEKLVEAMTLDPMVLTYFGVSESLIRNEVIAKDKYAKIKDFTAADKVEADTKLWSAWAERYVARVDRDLAAAAAASSDKLESDAYLAKRVAVMNSNNPRFLLRNHIVQEAIEDAENGSLTRARMLLKLMENPYSEEPANFILAEFADEFDQVGKVSTLDWNAYEAPPELRKCVKLTCSS